MEFPQRIANSDRLAGRNRIGGHRRSARCSSRREEEPARVENSGGDDVGLSASQSDESAERIEVTACERRRGVMREGWC
jgi:hypothetical protein